MKADLHVQIQYKGQKAGRMNHEKKSGGTLNIPLTNWQDVLSQDLQALHISEPEPEKINFILKSAQARFWWTTEQDGPFHRSLDKQIRDAMKPDKRTSREEVCIKHILLNVVAPSKHELAHGMSSDKERDGNHSKGKNGYPLTRPDAKFQIPSGLGRSIGKGRGSIHAPLGPFASKPQENEAANAVPSASAVSYSQSSTTTTTPTKILSGALFSPTRVDFSSLRSANLSPDRPTSKPLTDLKKFDLSLSGLKDLQRTLERRNSARQGQLTQSVSRVDAPQSMSSLTNNGSNGAVPIAIPIPMEVDGGPSVSSWLSKPTNGIKSDPEVEQQRIHERLAESNADIDNVPSGPINSTSFASIEKTMSSEADDVNSASSSTTLVSTLPKVSSQKSAVPAKQVFDEPTQRLWDSRRQRVTLVAREKDLIRDSVARGEDHKTPVSDTPVLMRRIAMLEETLNSKSEQLRLTEERLTNTQISLKIAQEALQREEQHVRENQHRIAHECQKVVISRERNALLKSTLRDCQQRLKDEKERRANLETVLDDLGREMKEPFVVSEVFEALIQIANISCMAEKNAELGAVRAGRVLGTVADIGTIR